MVVVPPHLHCMEYEKRCFYHGRWLTLKTVGQEITTVQEAAEYVAILESLRYSHRKIHLMPNLLLYPETHNTTR